MMAKLFEVKKFFSMDMVDHAVEYCRANQQGDESIYAMLRMGTVPIQDLSFRVEHRQWTYDVSLVCLPGKLRLESRPLDYPMQGKFQEFILEDGIPVTPAARYWLRYLAVALMMEHQKLHPPVVKGRHRVQRDKAAADARRAPARPRSSVEPYKAPVRREYEGEGVTPRQYVRQADEWTRAGYYKDVWVGSGKKGDRHKERRYIKPTICRPRKREG